MTNRLTVCVMDTAMVEEQEPEILKGGTINAGTRKNRGRRRRRRRKRGTWMGEARRR